MTGGDRWARAAVVVTLVVAPVTACSSTPDTAQRSARAASTAADVALPQGAEPFAVDPASFTLAITNPYWPMAPGDRWVFEEVDVEEGVRTVEITVLDRTRTVAMGVEARVVHDIVTDASGAVGEDTLDWYAQDSVGNVWYLGEETAEYEDGVVVSTAGSWEAGTDGALPGIVVPAHPEPGQTYRQEYLQGQAEDRAVVLSTSQLVQTPAGSYTDALLTSDTTPLDPAMSELKLYAPGVGPVLALQTSGGTSREALVQTTR